MAKQTNTAEKVIKQRIKRKGIHAKSKTSSLKSSKNYKKINVGQGSN